MDKYIVETEILDYNHLSINVLVMENKWHLLSTKEAVQAIYQYVQNQILFGYNKDDYRKASKVLEDGYEQCNTKSILLMALLRKLRIPCRMHGFIVDKAFQKGCLKGLYYKYSPSEIVHGWVEVYVQDTWYVLEGVILDKGYLHKLQNRFLSTGNAFHQYAVSTNNFATPPIDWDENDTYIQKESCIKDIGIFDQPDTFLTVYKQDLTWIKRTLYRYIIRHLMNRNIKKIRNG